jgi:cytochrome c oxidase subunit III
VSAANVAAVSTSPRALVTERPHSRGPGWWGMVLFVTTEATLFACLLASYFYVRFSDSTVWPPDGIEKPELKKALIMTGLLVSSSGPMIWADHAVRHNKFVQLRVGLCTTWLLGLVFLLVQSDEYLSNIKKFVWTKDAYASLFYTITGFHGFHVITGLIMVGFTIGGAFLGKFDGKRHQRIRLVGFYWHFIDIVWIFILSSLYLSPRL